MNPPFRFHNTLTRKVEVFEPLNPPNVTMYNCGPTVYGYLHLGNARNAVVFDALRRALSTRYQVTFVRNVTDVDDKIINRAKEEGVSWQQIAETYTQAYEEDMAKLGVLPPDVQPKATEHIDAMVTLIKTLIQQGVAYAVDGDVYYRVSARSEYGKLSGRKLNELQAGSRVEVDPRKEHPMDFALWKSAKSGEPSWPSHWGEGRPGWHIECSAMAMEYLGQTVDIHTGGADLIFPHHENEIAQSEAATGHPFAKYWLHNGMLEFQGGKMSKSVGNILDVREVLKEHDPIVLRYFLLTAQYRSSLEYGPMSLTMAKAAYEELAYTFSRLKELCGAKPGAGTVSPISSEFIRSVRIKFWDALLNDFNTPEALGVLFQMIKMAKRAIADPGFVVTVPNQIALKTAMGMLYECAAVLGIAPPQRDMPEVVWALLKKREEARNTKDFASADLIRNQLLQQGISIEDTPAGPIPLFKAK